MSLIVGHRRAKRQLRAVHKPGTDQDQLGSDGRSRGRLRSRAASERAFDERRSVQSGSVVRAGQNTRG